MNDNETIARIRFVGGPWHNRFPCVRWEPSLCMPDECPVSVHRFFRGLRQRRPDSRYNLVRLLAGNVPFYEYHWDGLPVLLAMHSGSPARIDVEQYR